MAATWQATFSSTLCSIRIVDEHMIIKTIMILAGIIMRVAGVAHARQGVYTATELRQYRPFMGDKYCSSPSGPHGLETNHPGLYWGKKHTVLIDIFCVIGIFFFDVVTLSWEWWAALIPNPSPYVRSVEKVWQTIKLVSIMNSFVIIMP